jgi:hypothetical protein
MRPLARKCRATNNTELGFSCKETLIKLNAKRELQLPRRIEEGWICFALQGNSCSPKV